MEYKTFDVNHHVDVCFKIALKLQFKKKTKKEKEGRIEKMEG